jgi:hypothetical protein
MRKFDSKEDPNVFTLNEKKTTTKISPFWWRTELS